MTERPSQLLIGLGETGLRTVAQVLTRWREAFDRAERPGVIGVGFGDPPPGFPPECYVSLSTDVLGALERVRKEDAPHIEAWLDASYWQNRWLYHPVLARPLERLLWVDEVARGDRSALFRLWLRELQHARSDRAILTFLVADLSELGGSSLVADAVFLTRAVAHVEANSEIKLWGYTVLPRLDAPNDTRMRAYAALRELSRLTSTHDGVHGEPFHYRPPTARRVDERIWRGSLTEKPFELWYCFEQSPEISGFMAGVIESYLSADAYDKALNHLINVSTRILPSRIYIGAVNVRKVTLPIPAFQRAWAAQRATEWLSEALRPPPKGFQPEVETVHFWRTLPNAQALELALLQSAHLSRGFDYWARIFDQGVFGSPTLTSVASTEDALRLRSEDDFPDPRRLNLDAICQQIYALRARVDRGRRPTDNLFRKLATEALTSRAAYFRAALTSTIARMLEEFGLVATSTFVRVLQEQAESMAVALGSLKNQDENAEQSYAKFTRAITQLEAICAEGVSFFQRARQLDQARTTLEDAQTNARLHLNTLRMRMLLETISLMLDVNSNCLQTMLAHLSVWTACFNDWRAESISAAAKRPSAEAGELLLSTDPHTDWGKEQYDRLTRKSPLPSLSWEVRDDRVLLKMGEATLTPENAKVELNARTTLIFAEARTTSTLPVYLQTKPELLEQLVPFLREAETQPLTFTEALDSRQESFGRLVVPEELDPQRRTVMEALETRLKAAHHRATNDDSLIQRQLHDSRHQLAYSFTVERIDLMREVPLYAELERLSAYYVDEAVHYYALGGEVAASGIEAALGRSGERIRLHPKTVSALSDQRSVFLFFTAYLLGIIDNAPQPNIYNSYQFGYRLVMPEYLLWLTRPLPSSMPNLWEAIKVFSAGKQVLINGEIASLSVSPLEVFEHIEVFRQQALREHTPQSPEDSDDNQMRLWLERAFRRATPKTVRDQIVALAAECRLLTEFSLRLADPALPHRSDQVQGELYRVGAALMDKRQEAQRKAIAELVRRLGNILS